MNEQKEWGAVYNSRWAVDFSLKAQIYFSAEHIHISERMHTATLIPASPTRNGKQRGLKLSTE